MSDDTKRVLKMIEAGKITADEGERLLAGLAAGQSAPPDDNEKPTPRFLKMVARSIDEAGKDEGFRMRVPLDLLRAGIKMRALVPRKKREKINEKLREKGIEGDIFEMSDDQINSLIRSLSEIEMEAADNSGSFHIYLE